MIAHVPTDELRARVREMAESGLTQDDIAYEMEIDPKTLRRHYADDLKRSRIRNVQRAGKKLFEMAMEGNTTCLIFYLKSQGGWREKQEIDVNMSGGVTVEHAVSEDVLNRLAEKL
jgi:predicted ArsR family transcriptional regulator